MPEEAAALAESDAGSSATSIRVDAAKPVETTDARTPDATVDAAVDAGEQADTAAPPPPPPPTTAACPSSDGVLVVALMLSGTIPPACNAGACNTGECCYKDQYCLPE